MLVRIEFVIFKYENHILIYVKFGESENIEVGLAAKAVIFSGEPTWRWQGRCGEWGMRIEKMKRDTTAVGQTLAGGGRKRSG